MKSQSTLFVFPPCCSHGDTREPNNLVLSFVLCVLGDALEGKGQKGGDK